MSFNKNKKTVLKTAILGCSLIAIMSSLKGNIVATEDYQKKIVEYEKAVKDGALSMPYIINKERLLYSSANLNNFSKDGSCLIEMGMSKKESDLKSESDNARYTEQQKKFLNEDNMKSEFFFTTSHERAHCLDLQKGGALELYFDSIKLKDAMNNITGGNNIFLPKILFDVGIKDKKFYPSLQILLMEGTAEAVSSINLINSEYYDRDVLIARAIRLHQDSFHNSASGVRDHATASISEYFLSEDGEKMAKSLKNASSDEIIDFSRKLASHNVLSLAKNIDSFHEIIMSDNYWKAHTASAIVYEGLKGAGMVGGENKNSERVKELNGYLKNKNVLDNLDYTSMSLLSNGFKLDETINSNSFKKSSIINLVMNVDVLKTDQENFNIIRSEFSNLITSFDPNKYPGFKSPGETMNSLETMLKEKDNEIKINKDLVKENKEHLFNSQKPILSI